MQLKSVKYTVRKIEPRDNASVERVIRACLVEFGANHEGTAWADPYLGRFSEVYDRADRCYWVAEDADGRIVGGTGIGPLDGVAGVCELQKMYCLPEARGTGIAQTLLNTAMAFAKTKYTQCYLETFRNMLAAQRFYEKNGFERLDRPLGTTGHFDCDVIYIKKLTEGN